MQKAERKPERTVKAPEESAPKTGNRGWEHPSVRQLQGLPHTVPPPQQQPRVRQVRQQLARQVREPQKQKPQVNMEVSIAQEVKKPEKCLTLEEILEYITCETTTNKQQTALVEEFINGSKPYDHDSLENYIRQIVDACVKKPQFAPIYTKFCINMHFKLDHFGFVTGENDKYVCISVKQAMAENIKLRGFREILVDLLVKNFYGENRQLGVVRMIGELFNGNILTRNLLEFILNELMNGQTHQDLVSILQLAYTVNDRLAKGPSADTIFIPIDPSQMDTERKFGRRILEGLQSFIPQILKARKLEENLVAELQNLYNIVSFSLVQIKQS